MHSFELFSATALAAIHMASILSYLSPVHSNTPIIAFFCPNARIHLESRLDWGQLASHIFLLHNLDQRTFFGINGSFWSVAAEVQLYMLYMVLIALIHRFSWGRSY